MPAKKQITKQRIVSCALDLVRTEGLASLNARRIAKELASSTKPIYLAYSGMEELKADVIAEAWKFYHSFIGEHMSSNAYPPYKAYGMAYISFADKYPRLYELLYMRSRTGEPIIDGAADDAKGLTVLLSKSLGISEENANLLQTQMWIFVHGIAAMIATDYLRFCESDISRLLTAEFEALKKLYKSNGEKENVGK